MQVSYYFLLDVLLQGIEGRYATVFNNTASVYDLALFFYTDDAAVLQQLNVQVSNDLLVHVFTVYVLHRKKDRTTAIILIVLLVSRIASD